MAAMFGKAVADAANRTEEMKDFMFGQGRVNGVQED